jgi:hypothetical protein
VENRGNFLRSVFLRTLIVFAIACLTTHSVEARDPSLAVIAEDLSGETDSGGLEMVESLAEAGVMETDGVSLVSRRHLEKILAEQGLAYNNVVNDRARLGRLAGANLLLVVSITKNRITQTRESVSAYGMTENIVRSRSDAGITVKALEVESGRIIAQRQFVKRTDNRRALDACAAEMKAGLSTIRFSELASQNEEVPRHKVLIKPTSGGTEIQGLDLFIDGNFVGNTPITTDVEEGVREVSLRQGSTNIWSNRVQVLKEIWLTPELGSR